MKKDIQDDENDTFSSAAASALTTEGASSTVATNESSYEFRDDGEDDADDTVDRCVTLEPSNNRRQHHRISMLFRLFSSPSRDLSVEKNAVTVVLIPAALVMVCAFFGASPLLQSKESLCIASMISSLSALTSHVSNLYMTALEDYPIFTKALTTGIIQLLGDLVAQRYEQQQQQQENDATTLHYNNNKGYDLRRGASLFADGLLLSGPLLHYCFEWMEEAWPTTSEGTGGGAGGLSLATLCHVFVNDYIIDSLYIGLSFVFTGLFEGYSLGQVFGIVRKDYWATVRASWLTSLGLIPVEIVCFGYLSLSLRVLAMNFVDLLWGAIVSFYSHRSRREHQVTERPAGEKLPAATAAAASAEHQ
jgi:hypothetical protein